MSLLIFITDILYLRDKLEYIEYSLFEIYSASVGGSLYYSIKNALYELFDEYTIIQTCF